MSALSISIVDRKEPSLTSTFQASDLLLNTSSDEAQSLLQQIHLSHSELTCSCVNPPARMFVRKCNGKYFLVNHYRDGRHADCCRLFTKVKGFREENSERESKGSSAEGEQGKIDHFVYHTCPHNDGVKRNNQVQAIRSQHSIRHHSTSKLELLYHQLVTESFANWYFPKKSETSTTLLFKLRDKAAEIRGY